MGGNGGGYWIKIGGNESEWGWMEVDEREKNIFLVSKKFCNF